MNKKKNKRENKMILNDDFAIYNEDKLFDNKRAMYENFQYLSYKERDQLQCKFTKPKNASQSKYINHLNDDSKKIVLATGPAGTGKTLFATEYGILNFLMGKYEKLILTRPNTSVDDENFGFLPGSLEEKMNPFVRPIFDILHRFISHNELMKLIEEKSIEIAPLGFMRGRTFKNTVIIADEMQNSSPSQMKCLLTRIGENSKVIITGDLEQSDRVLIINGLDDFIGRLKMYRTDSISSIEFDKQDIEREEVVKKVLDIYSFVSTPDNYNSSFGSNNSVSSDSDTSISG